MLTSSMVVGSLMCAIAEKYGELRFVTSESIVTPAFWLWHLWSFMARSVVGSSLMMAGAIMKKRMPEHFSGWGYGFAFVLLVIGFAAAVLNRDVIDLHFAFIQNPVLFYTGALCTTTALLIIGHGFHPKFILWCGRESLLLILGQAGFGAMCGAVNRLFPAVGESHVFCIMFSVLILFVGLIISYFAVWVIRHSFLKNLITPPERRRSR